MICWLTDLIRPFQHPNTRWPHTLHMKVWRKQHIIKLPMKRCWRWQGEWMRRLKSNPCSGTAVIVIGEWGTEDGSCCAEGTFWPSLPYQQHPQQMLREGRTESSCHYWIFLLSINSFFGDIQKWKLHPRHQTACFCRIWFFLRSAILFSDSTSPSSDYHRARTQCNLLHLKCSPSDPQKNEETILPPPALPPWNQLFHRSLSFLISSTQLNCPLQTVARLCYHCLTILGCP